MLLEKALADHPEDELPLAALQVFALLLSLSTLASSSHLTSPLLLAASQVLTTALAALAAASAATGGLPWDLPWGELLPHAPAMAGASAGAGAEWAVPAALAYTGTITTALTIWLQMVVFARSRRCWSSNAASPPSFLLDLPLVYAVPLSSTPLSINLW